MLKASVTILNAYANPFFGFLSSLGRNARPARAGCGEWQEIGGVFVVCRHGLGEIFDFYSTMSYHWAF